MHDFRKLEVWKKSKDLIMILFPIINQLPNEEKFGLISQMKRCSISIPSNIAEGCGRGSDKLFKYHIEVALGSSFELETQLEICKDLKFIDKDQFEFLILQLREISKMLIGLSKALKRSIAQ